MKKFINFAIKKCERFIEIDGGFGTHEIIYIYFNCFVCNSRVPKD